MSKPVQPADLVLAAAGAATVPRVLLVGTGAPAPRLERALRQQGFQPVVWAAGADPLSALRSVRPAAVLLLRAAGEGNCLPDLLRTLRQVGAVPCLVRDLAPSTAAERVAALELGLDDWMLPDLSCEEVAARVRAWLRRTAVPPTATGGAWRLSLERRELFTPDGTPCELTSAEFDFLLTLARRRGSPVSREVLSQAVFRRAWYPHDRGLDNLAARLRRKLVPRAAHPQVVKPVRGIGYALTQF